MSHARLTCCPLGRAALGAGLLLGALALLGGPDGSAQDRAPALPPDLKLIPDDADAFVTVRATDLLASPLLAKLLPALGKDPDGAFEELNRWPVAPKNVERFTLVVPAGSDEPALIIRSLAAYDREAALDKAHVRNKLKIK